MLYFTRVRLFNMFYIQYCFIGSLEGRQRIHYVIYFLSLELSFRRLSTVICFPVKFAQGVLHTIFASLKGHYFQIVTKNELMVVV